MKSTNFIILGPPASGKSTQGQLLAKLLGYVYLSSGELIKKAKNGGDDLSEEIKERFEKGIPQPDEVINKLVDAEINASVIKNFILDSYPLSLGQCKNLLGITQKLSLGDFWLVYIDLKENDATARMMSRKICPICQKSYLPADKAYQQNQCPDDKSGLTTREDDQVPVFQVRFREYESRTAQVREYFKNMGRLVVVDGKPTIEEINNNILGELKKRSLI